MPINPSYTAAANPCVASLIGVQPHCLPLIYVISGWHMLSDESLGWLKTIDGVETRSGPCFDDWPDDSGAARWVRAWEPMPQEGRVILAHCNKLLSWYPAFAGRYTSAWGKSYAPCKERSIAALKPGEDYYRDRMWQVCRPQALAAHDAAMGTGGVGLEATPPFVMRALYGERVRLVAALRSPVDRLETSFWVHAHYPRRYGASAEGLHAYVTEQTAAFSECVGEHGARRCAFLFELLDRRYSDVFFHCDQIIRGLYHPFVEDWHAAFGSKALLVLRVEDLIERPAEARRSLVAFLGGAVSAAAADAAPLPPRSYAALHAESLQAAKAVPMRNDTRRAAEAFYRPFNLALASLLGWPVREAWQHSSAASARV